MAILTKIIGFILIICFPFTPSFGQYIHLNSQIDVDNFDSSITVLTENLNIYDTDEDDPIVDLSNLSNITKFEGFLFISGLDDLDNIDALSNVTSIGGYLWINYSDAISDLDGFSNLTTIGGFLKIENNHVLTSLNGFSSLETIGEYLEINDNNTLTNCCGIQHLLSTTGAIGGGITIEDNPFECNSASEIISWCTTSSNDLLEVRFQLFPNPVVNNLYIEHEENELYFVITNAEGKELSEGSFQKEDSLDLEEFDNGIYFLRINNGKTSSVFKILKAR